MLRFSILLLAGTAFAQQYTISTVAGGAPPATPVAALSTSIGQPRKLVLSGSNVYFSSGNSIFKIDGSGTLTLIAGNSRAGFSGDGGPAVSAQLNAPQGLALDAAGNLYIADSLNNRVRRVDTRGVITTFAGDGSISQPGFWGDYGPAINASLHLPTGVAVDSTGNVYIAVSSDNTIRIVTTDGLINIFAGQGNPGYYGDYAATVTGTTTTVTNVGTATLATLTNPQDVAIGPNNTILIADAGNSAIRSVSSAGIISTISGLQGSSGLSGDGTANTLPMLAPFGVAADSSGNIYVAEFRSVRPASSAPSPASRAAPAFRAMAPPTRSPCWPPSVWRPIPRATSTSPNSDLFGRHHQHHLRPPGQLRPFGRWHRQHAPHAGPLRCGGRFLGQHLRRRIRHQPHPQARYQGQHHHGHRRWQPGLRRRWRSGEQGGNDAAYGRGVGFLGQPLLCRFAQQPHPQARRQHGQHHRRQRPVQPLGRWRRGYQRAAQCADGCCREYRRPVHRRYRQQHGAERDQRGDLRLRGHGHRRLFRRWQPG